MKSICISNKTRFVGKGVMFERDMKGIGRYPGDEEEEK